MIKYRVVLIIVSLTVTIFAEAQNGRLYTYRIVGNINTDYAKMVKVFADSLNTWKQPFNLPAFVYDTCLDANCVRNKLVFDDPVSFRWDIMSKVTNINALERIIQLSDYRITYRNYPYKSEVYPYLSIPFTGFSMKDLAIKRLENLNKK